MIRDLEHLLIGGKTERAGFILHGEAQRDLIDMYKYLLRGGG